MFSYRCRGCGNLAYSSADESDVGRCPLCEGALEVASPLSRKSGPEHTSAVRLLAVARGAQSRMDALERLSAGRADVAAREGWLHWVDEGESLAPWADGEWAPNRHGDTAARVASIDDRVIRQRISRGEDKLTRAVAAHARRTDRSRST
jgi:hypothetical protein